VFTGTIADLTRKSAPNAAIEKKIGVGYANPTPLIPLKGEEASY